MNEEIFTAACHRLCVTRLGFLRYILTLTAVGRHLTVLIIDNRLPIPIGT